VETHRNVVIIGSGPAGLTAAIYTARANLKPLLIRGPQPGGQLMGTTIVENWPGSITIMGPNLMITMEQQALQCGCTILDEIVEKVDFSSRPFKVWTSSSGLITTDSAIIATGNTPRRLGCPGENEYWGKGVSSCAVCDAALYKGRTAVVVGGGDSAMEMASFLSKFAKKVFLIHILEKFTASKAMQERVNNNPIIEPIFSSSITEIMGNKNLVTHITIKNMLTGTARELQTDGVFLAIGHKPQTELFAGQLELSQSGYLVTQENVKTSIDGIFGAGDVADTRYRQAITASGFGCMAALEAERYLERKSKTSVI
jgi:thioredoxin reductase (NADPH)